MLIHSISTGKLKRARLLYSISRYIAIVEERILEFKPWKSKKNIISSGSLGVRHRRVRLTMILFPILFLHIPRSTPDWPFDVLGYPRSLMQWSSRSAASSTRGARWLFTQAWPAGQCPFGFPGWRSLSFIGQAFDSSLLVVESCTFNQASYPSFLPWCTSSSKVHFKVFMHAR